MKGPGIVRSSLLILGSIVALSIACSQSAPTPATPTGGGAQATATRPAAASGGQATAPAGQTTAPAGGANADAGKALMTSKGCIACHTIAGVPGAVGTIGPALSDMGDPAKHPKMAGGTLDNNVDNMKKWLKDPPTVKPGTVMPNLNLSQPEIDNLVAYLQTLK